MRKSGSLTCCCGQRYDKPRSEGGRCQAKPSCDDFRKPTQSRICADAKARKLEMNARREARLLNGRDVAKANRKLYGDRPYNCGPIELGGSVKP